MVALPRAPMAKPPKAVASMVKQVISVAGSTNRDVFSSKYNTDGMSPSNISPTVADAAGKRSLVPYLPSASETPSGLTKTFLIPYAIQKVAAKELLYGGTRVIGLVQPPPEIVYHRSDLMKVPSPKEEVDMEGFNPNEFGIRLLPNNVGFRSRHQMLLIRYQDLLRRFQDQHRSAAPATARSGKSAASSFDRSKYLSNRTVFNIPSSIGVSHSVANGYKIAAGVEAEAPADENAVVSPIDGTNLPPHRRRRYHPSPSSLSILPTPSTSTNIYQDTSSNFGRARSLSSGVPIIGAYASPFHAEEEKSSGQSVGIFSLASFYDQERQRQLIAGGSSAGGRDAPYTGFIFKPYQLVMPVSGVFSYAMRSEGLRSPSGHLRQETLDRKGFGWRKKQHGMWQQDVGTRGFKPDKFY